MKVFQPTSGGSSGGGSIPGTITGGTDGSVLFIHPVNTLAQDNNQFYLQDSPTTPQQLATNTNVAFSINASGDFTGTDAMNIYGQYDAFLLNSQITNTITGFNTDGAFPGYTFSSSRGTAVSLSQLQTGDTVGGVSGWGTVGASPTYQNLGGMMVFASGATTNNLGGEVRFYTKTDNGLLAQRMAISNSGTVSIGSSSQFTVDISGNMSTSGTIATNAQQLSQQTFIGSVVGTRLQSTTANARSFLGIVPNGVSVLADVWVFSSNDFTTNFSAMAWGFDSGSGSWGWNVVRGGTGTAKNMFFNATGTATRNSANLFLSTNGNVGVMIGSATPTAFLHIGAGTASASTAPLKFTSGTNLTTAEAGATEYDGINLFFTPTGTIRKTIPTIVMGRQTAQTAAVASIVTQTVGAADTSYTISANVLVTTATVHSFTVTCAYTDEGNTARTLTLQLSTIAGAFVTAITNAQGTVPYEGVPLHIRAIAGSTITLATTGTFTTVTYNVEGAITQLK